MIALLVALVNGFRDLVGPMIPFGRCICTSCSAARKREKERS